MDYENMCESAEMIMILFVQPISTVYINFLLSTFFCPFFFSSTWSAGIFFPRNDKDMVDVTRKVTFLGEK